MSDWMKKRFWKEVSVVEAEDGFGLALDGRRIKTPLKTPLYVPSRPFAEQIATEWDAVGDAIDPTTMPFTRAANAAIDKLAKQKAEVVALLAEYGGCDLLCYRATYPEKLIAKQAQAWDPVLDWAGDAFGQRLNVTQGVLPVDQPAEPLAAMHQRLMDLSEFQLSGAYDLISISGSLVLALAVMDQVVEPALAWDHSRIDESWQIAEWGADEEAEAAAAIKNADFLRAALIFQLSSI